jgi:hypothetical protein
MSYARLAERAERRCRERRGGWRGEKGLTRRPAHAILWVPEEWLMSKYKVDMPGLKSADRQTLVELDEQIARTFQREIEQKRRDEEKSKKKRAKRKRT